MSGQNYVYECMKCHSTWHKGSKKPSVFARRLKVSACDKCERELNAKEKKTKELIAKQKEIQEAKIKLIQTKFKAESELAEKKFAFYESVLLEDRLGNHEGVKKNVLEVVENLAPLMEPDIRPEAFPPPSKKEDEFQQQTRDAEVRLEKIKMQQEIFEANRDLFFKKFGLYESMKAEDEQSAMSILDRIKSLKIGDIATGYATITIPRNDRNL